MPATEASPYSSPFILDLDMSENPEDLDFELFDSGLSFPAISSPSTFITQDFAGEGHKDTSGPRPGTQKDDLTKATPFLEPSSQALSARSSGSPAGSFQDSSSDSSRYKRKTSSDSSDSVLTGKDILMTDADMNDWKVDDMMTGHGGPYGGYDDTIDPTSMNVSFGFSDKSMDKDFDFDSAASSPSPFGAGPVDMESPEMPTIKYDTPRRSSPKLKSTPGSHAKAHSQHSITQSMHGLTTNGSREASPLSAMVASQESSPSAFFNSSPSPAGGVEFVSGPMLSGVGQSHIWPTGFDYGMQTSHVTSGLTPPSLTNNVSSPLSSGQSLLNSTYKPTLTIHPTPLKSRVETQIPIKMTLFPMPPGISKLHLPTHTISKPKLLAKPLFDKALDTLELTTTLVCTSAMQNPEYRRRAFARAAATSQSAEGQSDTATEGTPDEDDENRPLNGGEVKICVGCITRERKRAARKKVKKVEEEESWHKDEAKRVIVFNTQEIKDWQPPSSQAPSEATGDRLEPIVPDGAMQVDAPMRIACYCRHQNEKLGFQVIFTLKDCNDRLIAQEITSSIMITDDHKTHNMPQPSTHTANGSEGQTFAGGSIFPPESSFDMPMAPFRLSHSSSDLQTLQRNFNLSYPSSSNANTSHQSQNSSATMTPRNLSRQGSPSGSVGPSSKKRKASGSSKVPSGLAMTRLETAQASGAQNANMSSATTSTVPSPYTPSIGAFQTPNDLSLAQPSASIPTLPQQYNTGPLTPNSNDQSFFSNANRSHSMENLALHQLYSAPTSAHPSRAPSPNGLRNSVQGYQQQQAQIAQAVANGLYGIPLALNPHRPPTIHKMIPNEGPKAGGIEVTCLGSGFCQGLEVMFGDFQATTTTYWGETSLVCLLPPATFAGTVPVTFKHQHQQQQIQSYPTPSITKQQTFFKYVDDDEQQIIRTALSVLGHKMTGKMEDVRDLARRIVGDGPSSWSSSTGHSPSGGSQHQQVSGFNAATFGVDVEATLLRCLDLIDLDDSPHMPRLNLRRASGQTMLHLACALGLHRFVAALLARGANPEPRDKGGFTPMHFAAMHSHPQIVRRLILSGADPTMRSLQGYTPSDLATSEDVLRSTRRIERHSRTRSGESIRSRTSSATSLRSLWEQPLDTQRQSSPAIIQQEDLDSSEDDNEYENEDADAAVDGVFWMHSRRGSSQKLSPAIDVLPTTQGSHLEIPIIDNSFGGLASPTAAMTAFRDQLSAQIQHLQNSFHNLPNLPQMPTLPMIPNLPDYQSYLPTAPMVRRISSLVPHMGSRPGTAEQGAKETDYKWWDLFSGNMPAAPPAYDDIFPNDLDTKHASAAQAAADAVADNKCASLFDLKNIASSRSDSKSVSLEFVTREQQDQLRLAHAEKVKRLRSDRNLFFIWIPLLIVIVLAMLYNRVPQAWTEGNRLLNSLLNRTGGHIVQV